MALSLLKRIQKRLARSPRLIRRFVGYMVLGLGSTIVTVNAATAFSLEVGSVLGTLSISQSVSPNSLPSNPIAQVIMSGSANHPNLTGNLLLTETSAGLHLSGTLANVPPGEHGFHVHEVGSCAENGMAAGGHFNPEQVEHGHLLADGPKKAHAGDLGNVAIDSYGTVILDQTFPDLSLNSGPYAVAGRAIVLHEKADDFSQPNGNAGARIGCGVIVPLQ